MSAFHLTADMLLLLALICVVLIACLAWLLNEQQRSERWQQQCQRYNNAPSGTVSASTTNLLATLGLLYPVSQTEYQRLHQMLRRREPFYWLFLGKIISDSGQEGPRKSKSLLGRTGLSRFCSPLIKQTSCA